MQKYLIVFGFILVATLLEASGDALVRTGLFERVGLARLAVLLGGAILLFGYGLFLNLAPMPFERVVGVYVATLFIVWQGISFVAFGSTPKVPVIVGGALIGIGGMLVTFWTA
jgi:hypothetical protein